MLQPPPLEYASPLANAETRRCRWRRARWLWLLLLLGAAALIAAVSSMVVPRHRHEPSKASLAKTDISNLDTALDAFNQDTGRYPTQAEGLKALIQRPPGLSNWKGPYVKQIWHDPFGRPYQYTIPGRHVMKFVEDIDYDLFSCGPDNLPGTRDDIGHW